MRKKKGDFELIIGLTSFLGAGKTSVGDYLVQKKGFVFYSLSDVIREEITKKGQEITREKLQLTGNDLRRKFGNNILARRVLEKIGHSKKKNHYVVDSIRNPAEVEALRKNKGFALWFIDAPIELRFERVRQRQREKDPITFNDFKASEDKELKSKDSANQQLLKCREMTDAVIINDSSVEELYKKIDKLLEGL
ncbi:AAA family ATPase [Candidatus Woesearchaeota archaeon]|nr:AAA family ATPase [Candidatus Woesearchaeota archaeon]